MGAEPEPLPESNGGPRIFAFVDDLFFLAKIQEVARKLNVKVEFVKTEKDLAERMSNNGEEKPSLIIFDLNNAGAKPLALIPKLKSKLKKGTSIIGFLSHVQGDLKLKAQEAGCDMVLPRSAFSQNLPQLLRRHGAPEELEQ
jgi:DNA-binding NarL/FixJ family response regulator